MSQIEAAEMLGVSERHFRYCRGAEAVVIEGTGLASAASGRSGGFLALDWYDGTPLEVLARQACYRPVTRDGLPLIGAVPGVPGAYVATGHSVWGILNAPATSEAIAELILDGRAAHVDLSSFDPARLPPVDPGP